MLEILDINQFALIDKAELSLGAGFNCITGETGAGKSLLLGAISALSGKQVSKDLIRKNASSASIAAVYTDVKEVFADSPEILSLIAEDDQLILSRELKTNGRNLCRINGHLVPLSLLREAGDKLMDIHGQNDRQQIFQKSQHLKLLDNFARAEIQAELSAYQKVYKAYKALERKEREILTDPEERRIVLEQLEDQINEIEAVNPQPGEDEALRAKKTILQNREKISRSLMTCLMDISGNSEDMVDPGGNSAAIDNINDVISTLQDISTFDKAYQDYLSTANEIVDQLYDLKAKIQESLDFIDLQEEELEQVNTRLDKISKLKHKYNGSIESIWAYHQAAQIKYAEIQSTAAAAEKIKSQKQQVLKILSERGEALSKARKSAARRMEIGIEKELADLGMADAKFRVQFTEFGVEAARSTGLEDVEFLLAANVGSDLKPLAKTASGGEASRIMLAIKVVLAKADNLQLLVFDEIDTGISGETSRVVAEKLHKLSETHQVICVTHQAQIAAMADKHFYIYKTSADEMTSTYIKELSNQEREAEIARLLSGNSEDLNSLELAKNLLAR